MVSLGDNLIGSQFFFTLGCDLTSLDGVHCVIGQVVEGLEVLRKLNETICDNSHRPYQDIRITHTVILEDPFENPRGFREPSRSPSPSTDRLKGGRIGADEDIDDTEGKTEVEVQEMLQDREAKARATILEIVGDLPDADIAPPENVLFVCKLNAVTSDDDLEIIFSRFGKVKGCEVIRDRVTGDSLQYAFVEFEDTKSCEAAYFKMDNVLIDDRRIHVDFSQSVAKIQWRGKGRGLIIKDGSKDNRLNFTNYKTMDNKGKGFSEKGRRNSPKRFDRNSGNGRDGNFNDRRRSRSPRNGNDRGNRRSPDRRNERNNRRSPIRDARPRQRSRSPRRMDQRPQKQDERPQDRIGRDDRSRRENNQAYSRGGNDRRSRSRSRGNNDRRPHGRPAPDRFRDESPQLNRDTRDTRDPRDTRDVRRRDVEQKPVERKEKPRRSPSHASSDGADKRPKKHKSSKKSKKSKKRRSDSSESDSDKKHKKSKKKSKKSKKAKRRASTTSDSSGSSSSSSS